MTHLTVDMFVIISMQDPLIYNGPIDRECQDALLQVGSRDTYSLECSLTLSLLERKTMGNIRYVGPGRIIVSLGGIKLIVITA